MNARTLQLSTWICWITHPIYILMYSSCELLSSFFSTAFARRSASSNFPCGGEGTNARSAWKLAVGTTPTLLRSVREQESAFSRCGCWIFRRLLRMPHHWRDVVGDSVAGSSAELPVCSLQGGTLDCLEQLVLVAMDSRFGVPTCGVSHRRPCPSCWSV